MQDKNIATLEKNDGFNSKWGFILSCIGSAVGMGNIWRLPIMVSLYGGMTFLLPFFIFVILIASSGVICEFALGRHTGSGPVGAFGKCTESRWGSKKIGELIGIIPLIGSLAFAIGYTVVVGWIFKYAYLALTGKLFALGTDIDTIVGVFSASAPETANFSQSVATVFGGGANNNFWLLFGLIVSLCIMGFGISSGIEKANKIMMPALFTLFIALAIYIATLPGASDGYKYIFTIDFELLKNPVVWIFAFGQAFFSLSVGGTGSVVYGSYLSKSEDIVYAAKFVAIFDTLSALLASLVIIPAMAVGGAMLNEAGPGLMFIWLVNIFNGMPGGKIVGILFFVSVLFAGVSSLVNLYETSTAYLHDKLKIKRVSAVAIIGTIGGIVALSSQGICSPWMDALSIYINPFGALLAGVMFFWVLKKSEITDAVNAGAKKPIGKWFVPLGKYIYVPLPLIAIIAGALLGGIG